MNKANECTCPSGDGSLVHPCPAHPAVEQAGTNVGHGHVFPRADGVKMRCGGPGLCSECTADASRARAALAQRSEFHQHLKECADEVATWPSYKREALTQPSPKCATCGGTGMVDDGEITCSQGGIPYENGPVKCVKDCPDCKAQPSPAQAEQPTADDYEEVLADHRRLVREMDVLLNGEACAAKQAMLCDLVSQVEAGVRKSGQPLLVSAERYRWLRNDDNWGADDSEGQGTSKWANLGELSGTDFDAYLDQLRGSNPVMDIDPEHSKAMAKRGRDAIVAQAEGAPVIGCLCGMPMTEGRHSPGGCASLEEFAPNPAQAQVEQAEGAHVPDEVFAGVFSEWWEEEGQYCRAGGGDYERTFAFQAWRHLYPLLLQARAALAQPSPALPPFAEKVLAKLRRFYDCAEDFESGGVDIGRHWLDLLTQLGLLNRVQRSPALWEISQQGEDLLGMPQPSPAPELPERGTQHRFGTNEQSCRHDFAGVWWNDNGETKTGRECRHCGFFVADVAEQAEAERPEVFGLERYRVEKTGQGFWPYCVRAGDGTRELFVGHLKQCKRVAAQLATAFEDGKFIAQHESIVGGLRAEITQLRQHKNDYMDAGQETYRALQNEIREREAEIARLDGLVSGRTAERDAALARVAELEQKSAGSWTVDTSCGRPILMYEGCSVIEDQTAYEVIRMIKWIGELERQEPVATVAKVPGEDWNSLDFHRDLQDMQPGTKFYAAPVAQAQQLHDLDKQCRDDVARALGLRPNQERGFAWSYLLASIKSCVKASEDSAQAQHSVPDGWKLVPVEPTPEMLDARRDCEDGMDGYLVEDTEYYFPDRGAVRAFLARVYQGLIAAAPAPGGER